MKSGRFVILGLLLTVLGGVTPAGEIPQVAFPSEDEVEQALETGEISFDDYLILSELLSTGLDSTNRYLLDHISDPGLRLLELDTTISPDTQGKSFDRIRGTVRHAYSQYLEDEGDVKYQTSIRAKYNRNLSANLRIKREYSGRERVVYRAVSYQSDDSRWTLTAGNFSDRFGLGAIFGYRGKLVEYSREIDRESWLFPDYGGHNGVLIRARANDWTFRGAHSTHRDSLNTLSTEAIMAERAFGRMDIGLIGVHNQLSNRITHGSYHVTQVSLWSEYVSRSMWQSIEVVAQSSSGMSSQALVTEGKYKTGLVRLNLSGWWYSSRFSDLSSGSRSGTVSRQVAFDEPEFRAYSRRSGLRGGRIQSLVAFPHGFKLDTDLLLSKRNGDSSDYQWSAELSRELRSNIEIGLEFYQRQKRRIDNEPSFMRKDRWRLNLRCDTGSLRVRQSVGYTEETGSHPRYSVLTQVRARIPSYGEVELWSNLSQADRATGQVENWYGFVRGEFLLAADLSADVKFGRYYRRNSLPKYRSVVSVTLEYSL